ncbi:hypothetical protein [Enterococcus faecalis]|uniref:hypothetical protein n=1 Tax=Enterococcus faecalis TaxID=1351 RepID=UPI00215A9B36|nr:hypothetical protein [Enterococcus faecalis]
MNSIIGEMDLTKYFILLIFPFFLLYIFKFFLNQSFVRKSNIPKRELKEQKINLIELQKKSFVYYSFLINIYFVLHLVMVIFLGMFLGSFYEYGYFTNQSNAISYAFFDFGYSSNYFINQLTCSNFKNKIFTYRSRKTVRRNT